MKLSCSRIRLVAALSLSMLILSAPFLKGQTSTSTISGTVTDQSSAVVAGAKVTVRNVDTGVAVTLTSDTEGRYRVPEVIIGNYEIRVSAAGFETVVRSGVSTALGLESIVDIALPVGQSQQVVTIDAQVSQVDTTNTAISLNLDQQQINDLPMGTSRNFTDLINLAPGVVAVPNGGGNLYGQQASYTASGSRPTGLGFLIDNTNLTTFQNKSAGSGGTGSSPGIEAITQYQVLTNTYSAQFGGNGIVVNAASKSGTNGFHGSAYTFLGNSALNARAISDLAVVPPHTTAGLPPNRTVVGGAALGGPIRKDRMFFFVNYEALRNGGSNATLVQNLPDAQAHQGYLPCNVAGPTYGCNSATNLAYVGFAPGIQPLMSLLPVGTIPALATNGTATGLGNQYISNAQANHDNYLLSRIDYTFSTTDSIFVRVVSEQAYRSGTTGIGVFNERDGTGNWYATLEERHIISPTMINLARVSFLRPQEIGSQNSPAFPALQIIPGAPVSGVVIVPSGNKILGPNQSIPFNTTQDGYQAMDDVIWTHGAHNLRFGIGTTITQDFTVAVNSPGGQLQFNSMLTFLQGSPAQIQGPLPGLSYANRDMLERLVTPYVHDEWKVSRKLTLNIGLRYEWASNPTERRNNLYTFTSPATNTTWVNIPHAFANNPTNKNFAPRFGFAFDPFGDHKTSIRGGFGIFYDVMTGHIILPGYWGSFPNQSAKVTNPPFPNPSLALTAAALPVPLVTGGLLYGNGKTSTPYAMQYNFNIQRELVQHMLFQVAYVGSRGVHLLGTIEENPPQLINGRFATLAANGNSTANPAINPKLGSLQMRSTWGNSVYNGLQVSLTRRFTNNFSLQTSYAFSKSLDYGSSFSQDTAVGNNVITSDPYDTSIDRGRSTFDRTQVLRINATYQLPFSRNEFVHGWRLTGIWSQNTGAPDTINDGFSRSGIGSNQPSADRPNLASGCSQNPIVNRPLANGILWFDPTCFVLQPAGTLGTVGRTTVTGPPFKGMNFGLLKDTRLPKVSELFTVQFRAEVANLFNHPSLALNQTGGGQPNQIFTNGNVNADGSVGTRNPNAGIITGQIGSGRTITLALKATF